MTITNKQPGQKRPITDRLNAALAWLVTGETEKAGELCNIPGRTIRDWMNEASWAMVVGEAKRIKQAELDQKFTQIIHKAAEETIDRLTYGDEVVTKGGQIIRKKMSGKETALTLAVVADKRAIVRGEPTSISRRQGTKEHLDDVRKHLEEVGDNKNIAPNQQDQETGQTKTLQ